MTDRPDDAAPLPPPPAEIQFQARVHLMTPRVWVTPLLVAANAIVFVAMVIAGVHPLEPSIDNLLSWQANYGPLTIGEGEWWRLGTSTFLHIGIIHIAFNMYVLWSAGPLIERLLGNLGFLGMYLVSGLVGSLASLGWHPFVVSAGASGAVFGVFGALFGFLAVRRHDVPLAQLAQLRNGAAAFVLFNVVFGASVPGIDMAAHLGGLGAGFVCGLILALPVGPDSRRRRPARYAILALVGAAAVVIGARALPQPYEPSAALQRTGQIEERYNDALERQQAGELTREQFIELMEDDILPAWRAVRAEVEEPGGLPRGIRKDKVLAYVRLQQEFFELVTEAHRTGDPGVIERLNAKRAELERLMSADE